MPLGSRSPLALYSGQSSLDRIPLPFGLRPSFGRESSPSVDLPARLGDVKAPGRGHLYEMASRGVVTGAQGHPFG